MRTDTWRTSPADRAQRNTSSTCGRLDIVTTSSLQRRSPNWPTRCVPWVAWTPPPSSTSTSNSRGSSPAVHRPTTVFLFCSSPHNCSCGAGLCKIRYDTTTVVHERNHSDLGTPNQGCMFIKDIKVHTAGCLQAVTACA